MEKRVKSKAINVTVRTIPLGGSVPYYCKALQLGKVRSNTTSAGPHGGDCISKNIVTTVTRCVLV